MYADDATVWAGAVSAAVLAPVLLALPGRGWGLLWAGLLGWLLLTGAARIASDWRNDPVGYTLMGYWQHFGWLATLAFAAAIAGCELLLAALWIAIFDRRQQRYVSELRECRRRRHARWRRGLQSSRLH
jgi:hypothetical protein